ncbi:hypothetical protein RclHR1_02740017 [Rhizophagus clarus]|uniref:Uncharacterized protein n=1 Tax=Rhizophagus clarus TaxID=94130 RepID=A0A2Z6RWJ3_9GLOM|nr:hypothetical protein RclHR1_02740017 [Rhizophagus clarus]GES88810.1 hypothetical protein GLOIN_2v1604376 [Rhizophagus clarus]
MTKIIKILLLLATLLWTISSAPVQQFEFHIFNRNPTCVHAKLSPNIINSHQYNETKGIDGYISSCYFNTKQHQTVIRGSFSNLPGDSNKRNYHFYLLNPDNSLRRDLSSLFQSGLMISNDGKSAELSLNLRKSSSFPLEGVNSYVDGWVKLYHLHDGIISSAGPAQFHQMEKLLLEKEL